MEADGLEQIEQSGGADAGDFYRPPATLGPQTTPNSDNYQGLYTGITVDSLSTPGVTMKARFRIDKLRPARRETLSLKSDYVCGIKTDGSVACWGGLTPRRPAPSPKSAQAVLKPAG